MTNDTMNFIEFNALSWSGHDETIDTSTQKTTTSYVIDVFGRKSDGRSVFVRISGFMPFFYVKRTSKFRALSTRQNLVTLIETQARCGRIHVGEHNTRNNINDFMVTEVFRRDTWGYQGNPDTRGTFFLVECRSARITRGIKDVIWERIARSAPSDLKIIYDFVSQPFLRLFHLCDIDPSGWLCMKGVHEIQYGSRQRLTNCKEEYELIFNQKDPLSTICRSPPSSHTDGRIAPFICASFDIECTSHDGLFPTACKEYDFLAHEIVDMWGSTWKKLPNNIYEKIDAIQAFIMRAMTSDEDSDFLPRYRIAPEDRGSTNSDGYARVRHQVGMIVDDIRAILESSVFRKIGTKPVTPEQATQQISKLLSDAIRERRLPRPLGDEIIQIGTTFYGPSGHPEDERKVVVVTGSCAHNSQHSKVEIIECLDEQSLILRWAKLIHDSDTDVLVGYNTFGFDIAYIRDRLSPTNTRRFARLISRRIYQLNKDDEFEDEDDEDEDDNTTMDRNENPLNGTFRVTNLTSSAMGDNEFTWLDISGRICIDLMHIIKRDHKLDSYKLDDVAEHFTGQHKHDITPSDIFRLNRGSSQDRLIIAEYCAQDCTLVSDLMVRLGVFSGSIGMSNVCKVPLQYIFIRGQGIKVFSLILHECCLNDAVFPWLPPPPDISIRQAISSTTGSSESTTNVGYEGAIVLEPQPGIYRDNAVAVMDYASLYPSSMIAENLSHDRLVIPGISPNPLPPDTDFRIITIDTNTEYTFIQGEPGILPRTLKKLLDARRITRKKLANVVTSDAKMVLDGLQLAYKITANSLYGQLGASTSPIRHTAIAASTTAVGRSMIISARSYMESEHGANVIYGDSVAGYTPIVIRIAKCMVTIETVEFIANAFGLAANSKWKYCSNSPGRESKESLELVDGIEVWTDDGWTNVPRLIRHNLAPHKSMIRIVTPNGVVDVTDDHSLLRPNGTIVSPVDLCLGDELLHADMPEFMTRSIPLNCRVNPLEARVMGMFMGCGGCVSCATRSGPLYSWALSHMDCTLLETYVEICDKLYIGLSFQLQYGAIDGTGGRIIPIVSNDIEYTNSTWDMGRLVKQYRDTMYRDPCHGNIIFVPSIILNSSDEVRHSFWEGLCDAQQSCDKPKNERNVITLVDRCERNQMTSASVFALASSLSLRPKIESFKNGVWYTYRISTSTFNNDDITVQSMERINYTDEYVYDFTTENHKFSAGIGRIVVHNTDSIFCVFPEKGNDVNATINVASNAAKIFTSTLRPPHVLEYEKTFWPFILITKKRYIGNVYESEFDPIKVPKRQAMGIVLKRRDNAPIVKRIYGGLIDVLLALNNTQTTEAAESFLKAELRAIVAGHMNIDAFITSKRLRLEYKDPTRIAHNVLAKRIAQRDPGSRPRAGDRVQYVYIDVFHDSKRNASLLQGERIEHPKYIIDNKLSIDFKHYITNQIMKPVCQLLSLTVDQLSGFTSKHAHILAEHTNDEKKREAIVKELLFDPVLIPRNVTRITDFYKSSIKTGMK